jgi:putative Holliday junction resolvase
MQLPKGGLLALDWGLKKVGVATLDETGSVVTPRAVHLRREAGQTWSLNVHDKAFLARLLTDYEPGALVLGLPLNADGSESKASGHARRFRDKLAAATGLEVHLVSEVLSSWVNKEAANDPRRGLRSDDSLAAATLLEDYLSSGGKRA